MTENLSDHLTSSIIIEKSPILQKQKQLVNSFDVSFWISIEIFAELKGIR